MCAQNGYFIKLDNGYFKILTYLTGNVSGNTLKQRLVSWSNHSTYRWTCVFESVVSIETIVLQVPWQWYSNWKRIFAYILESNKECKQRKACLDFFVLVFDRKHTFYLRLTHFRYWFCFLRTRSVQSLRDFSFLRPNRGIIYLCHLFFQQRKIWRGLLWEKMWFPEFVR